MVQICRNLSLELMSFDVAPQQDLYTKQGVAVTVEARGADQGEIRPRVGADGSRTVSGQQERSGAGRTDSAVNGKAICRGIIGS